MNPFKGRHFERHIITGIFHMPKRPDSIGRSA
jgi:hypothetical protein